MNTSEDWDYLKGATYDCSPLNITLAIFIVLQNATIVADYFKDRTKFIPSMFMAIAIADMLMAQGQMVLSLCSILVYRVGLN